MLIHHLVENFKGLRRVEMEPGDLTVVTGMNSSGKTSLLQSLAFLKQSILAGEVTYDGNLVRLGSFLDVAFFHQADAAIHIRPTVRLDGHEVVYDVTLWQERIREEFHVDGRLCWVWDSAAPGVVEPYVRVFLNQASKGYGGGSYDPKLTPEELGQVQSLQRKLVAWFDALIPLAAVRGFTKYGYPLLAGPPQIGEVSKRSGEGQLLEEWLSSLILYRVNESRRDPSLRPQLAKVSERLGRLGVDISPYILGGPSAVIDLIEGELWVSSVNAGYGINQIVPAITLGTLAPKGALVTIEEPEIHLHPKTQRTVAEILCEIAEEGKQMIFTTHSPYIVSKVHEIYADHDAPIDVRVFYVQKADGKATYARYDVRDAQILQETDLAVGD